jgi:hypothetical protein
MRRQSPCYPLAASHLSQGQKSTQVAKTQPIAEFSHGESNRAGTSMPASCSPRSSHYRPSDVKRAILPTRIRWSIPPHMNRNDSLTRPASVALLLLSLSTVDGSESSLRRGRRRNRSCRLITS